MLNYFSYEIYQNEQRWNQFALPLTIYNDMLRVTSEDLVVLTTKEAGFSVSSLWMNEQYVH